MIPIYVYRKKGLLGGTFPPPFLPDRHELANKSLELSNLFHMKEVEKRQVDSSFPLASLFHICAAYFNQVKS
jgi:hypothetical protein